MNRLPLTILALCLLPGSVASTEGAQLLTRRKMFVEPDIYVMTKADAVQHWSKETFCQVYSSSPAYVIDTNYYYYHVLTAYVDPCWNRIMYMEQANGQATMLRAYGEFGFGKDSLQEPVAIKIISPTSNEQGYADYYNLYVADRQNHRVQRLRYRWTSPDSGLVHVVYMHDTEMWRPTDLDVSNLGTFAIDWDDVTWVVTKNSHVLAFNNGGINFISYGSQGSAQGQFEDLRAIVCGKTLYNSSTDVWFANNLFLYVLDAGNDRIVKLERVGGTVQWRKEFVHQEFGSLTDLEVDVTGSIWAVSSAGTIFKFTDNLDLLGMFGGHGIGENEFIYPVSIANTGGHLGGGDMMICDHWSDSTGIQHHAITTDISDLFVDTEMINDTCWSHVIFTLVDYSDFVVNIYNSSNVLVRHLANSTAPAGHLLVHWNGKNDSGVYLPLGQYRVEVTATSLYIDSDEEPANQVTKSYVFGRCPAACSWKVGDADGNGIYTISDAVFIITYIFGGGPAPTPHIVGSGDADCSVLVTISDPVYMINFIFGGGPAPQCTCAIYQ